MNHKILFIDPIDKGYRNFLRLNYKFNERGYETLLVHATSFNHPVKDKEHLIDGLLLRDISYYRTKLFRNVIEREKPCIILIVNLSFVLDRAIVNIAKEKNIKIVYLAHGSLTNPSKFDKARENLDRKIKGNTKRIFSKKNLYGLWNYIDSKKHKDKIPAFIKLIKGIMTHPAQYLTLAKYDDELDADLMLVYENKDKKLLVEKMNFPENKIKVVGNPEITSFINLPILDKKKFLWNIGIHRDNYVVYLDDGLVANKIWTRDKWYGHLISIAKVLEKKQMQLVVKLHPRVDINEHSEFFLENKDLITSIVDADFKNLLYHCKLVISHYSSTIVYALLFYKKIIVPKWDRNSLALTNKYPENIVVYCGNIKKFEKEVNTPEISNQDVENINIFLKENGVDISLNSIDLIINSILLVL